MLKFLIKLLVTSSILISTAYADIIDDVIVNGNNRISKQTIITYGNIKLNSDYNASDINQILRKLYETNFFKNLTIKIVDNKILIDVEENKIIQTLLIEGVKSNKVKEAIKEIIYSKDKSPFLINKVKEDVNKIKGSLNNLGYYFAEVETKTIENNNDTVNLILNIKLGDQASIGLIEFIGDKKFKDRTLRNVIISEEKNFGNLFRKINF